LQQHTQRVSYSTEEEEDSFRSVSVAAATSLKNTFLEIAMISLISGKSSKNRCYSNEKEDAFRSVSVAAATSLKNKFLEIAMMSLISEKAPRNRQMLHIRAEQCSMRPHSNSFCISLCVCVCVFVSFNS